MNTRNTGSISLFICVFLAVILLIGSTLASAALDRKIELNLARALDSQVQIGLAAYDRDLLEQFGLFGVRPDNIDQSVFSTYMRPLLPEQNVQLGIVEELFSSRELGRQIVNHMQERLPLVYMENFSRFITGWNQGSSEDNTLFSEASSYLAQLPVNETQRAASGLFSGLLAKVQEDSARLLEDIYRRYASELAGVPADDGLAGFFEQVPDFFDPASMSIVAEKLDLLLDFQTMPAYRKMCLTEYIMGYFCSTVRVIKENGTTRSLLTIDGRYQTGFPETRNAEIEKILTGLDNPDTAVFACRIILVSLRCVIQLGSIIADETQMTAFRSAAAGISASVAALTSGAVVIDPEIVTWLLVVGKALFNAWAEYQKMEQGFLVPFWPGASKINIDLGYNDYLRLLLFIQPDSHLLEGCSGQIGKVLPGTYAAEIEAATVFNGNRYVIRDAYP